MSDLPRPSKACPVVLRGSSNPDILAFVHPRAGLQLVKGTIEAGESPAEAALRELREEAGVSGLHVADLGTWATPDRAQVWSFQRIEVTERLPETWIHRTLDDGGHDFRFFWHPLCSTPSDDWHVVYRHALARIRSCIA